MELRATKILYAKNETIKVNKGTDSLRYDSTFLTPSPRTKSRMNYNRLIPYSRIPNKNFHFHELTYESTFLPKVIVKSGTKINRSEMPMTPSPRKPNIDSNKSKKMLKKYIIPAYYPYPSPSNL